MKQKPLLAAEFNQEQAKYPYLATPKIDGIRFLVINGQPVSRSLKPIRNDFIRYQLSLLPEGTDGEITVGDSFNETSSAVMSKEGSPEFKVWIFDIISDEGYVDRLARLVKTTFPIKVELLIPVNVENFEELQKIHAKFIARGFEGTMLRSPKGKYKFGRSTVKENILLKYKDFKDTEACIIGFEEQMHNNNPCILNELGYSERADCKENLVPKNTLGALIVQNEEFGVFRIGTGFDDATRALIWHNRDSYIGQLVKFKYFPYGIKDGPRHPVFVGFRNKEDL